MTTPQISPGQAGSAVPVACTLTPADLGAQAARWQHLMARAMTERAETADGLRMSFRREPRTEEELRTLVAVESECCAWADWTVGMSAGNLILEVRSADAGIATLHGMFC